MSYADACELATFVINFVGIMYVVTIINRYERQIRKAVFRKQHHRNRPPWLRR